MKTKALLATLLLVGTSLQADDTVEANVILSFKIHEQDAAPVIKGKTSTLGYQTFTLKNFDIIQMLGEKEGVSFTKKAKLIYQATYDENLLTGYSYRIREPGMADVMVTQYFDDNNLLSVVKLKKSVEKGTGTATVLGLGEFDMPLTGDFEGLYLDGPLKASVRILQSPTSPDMLFELTNLTMTLVGMSKLGPIDNIKTGYATGSFKYTGMKILK